MTQPFQPKLSICIATYNRARFIGETIESIISQATSHCEIVVSDNASTDNTAEVVAEYARRFERLRYVRQDHNRGFDGNFDRAVEFANGEYCWLMADDDLLKPGAIATVLKALEIDPSVVIVNVEARSCDMSQLVQRRWLDLEADQVYAPDQMERLFVDARIVLKYVGCAIIKRALWLERERQRYYGTWFIWLGVIFQKPLPASAMVIAQPLVSYRNGNAVSYSLEHSEIWLVKLPAVIASLTTVSEAAKNTFWMKHPWRNFNELLRVRAFGLYSLTEYRRWVRPQLHSLGERLTPAAVAVLPGFLVNTLFVLYYTVTRRHRGVWQPEMELARLRGSRFHFRNWRVFKRALNI